MEFGWLLYIVLAALLFFCFPHFRGKSMDDLFADDDDLHHRVHRIGKKHPRGGTWGEYASWVEEDTRSQSA